MRNRLNEVAECICIRNQFGELAFAAILVVILVICLPIQIKHILCEKRRSLVFQDFEQHFVRFHLNTVSRRLAKELQFPVAEELSEVERNRAEQWVLLLILHKLCSIFYILRIHKQTKVPMKHKMTKIQIPVCKEFIKILWDESWKSFLSFQQFRPGPAQALVLSGP